MFDTIVSALDGWTVVWIAAVASSTIGFGFLLHSTFIAWKWPKAVGHVAGNTSSYAHHDSGHSIVCFADITFAANDRRDYTVRRDVGYQTPRPSCAGDWFSALSSDSDDLRLALLGTSAAPRAASNA